MKRYILVCLSFICLDVFGQNDSFSFDTVPKNNLFISSSNNLILQNCCTEGVIDIAKVDRIILSNLQCADSICNSISANIINGRISLSSETTNTLMSQLYYLDYDRSLRFSIKYLLVNEPNTLSSESYEQFPFFNFVFEYFSWQEIMINESFMQFLNQCELIEKLDMRINLISSALIVSAIVDNRKPDDYSVAYYQAIKFINYLEEVYSDQECLLIRLKFMKKQLEYQYSISK